MSKQKFINIVRSLPALASNFLRKQIPFIPNESHNYIDNKTLNNTGLYYNSKKSFGTSFKSDTEVEKSIYIGGDFKDLVTQSTIFVDKSLFIEAIINDPAKAILITMPRRWGKSLNLDMLRRFLSEEEEDNNENYNSELFKGGTIKLGGIRGEKKVPLLKIHESYINLEQGKYPVIFMDFKDCKGTSLNEVKIKLEDKITETVRNFSYLKGSEKKYKETTVGKEYEELLSKVKNNSYFKAIKDLSALLHTHHNKKVWILVDEYDAAANKAYLEFNEKEAEQVSTLFREIFEPALKGNEHLEKGVITGVQYIVQSGMLSGLNNLSKYNITNSKYSKYYGIDQEEMKGLMEHFHIDQQTSMKIKDWYNGYQENIGTVENPVIRDKYNIWSVVKYLNNQADGYKSYWENNSLSEIINKEILKHVNIKHIIEDLVNNKPVTLSNLISDFDIRNFKTLKELLNQYDIIEIKQDGIDLLFSYLFILGYLTNIPTSNEYVIPNKEIKVEFEAKLKDFYSQIFNISPSKFNAVTREISLIFSEHDNKEIFNILTQGFAPKLKDIIQSLEIYNSKNEKEGVTVKGVFGNEDLMHSLLNNIAIQVVNAKFASERTTTKSDGTRGRADIVLSKNGKGIVIEMKYNKSVEKFEKDNKELAMTKAKEALSQAKTYSELVESTNLQIFIGCNITDKQEVYLSGDIISKDNGEVIHFEYP